MTQSRIMVVDDQPINVQLLKRKLEREGMAVIATYSGTEALELAREHRPDLILLDVMMPDMDGIEVCVRLQKDELTRSIPVIFITARSSKEGKLEGLGVGAVDYITKPIDLDETLARVQTQLRFLAVNRELIELQRRLVESRRNATIGAVTQGIAHNLNNLLGVVIGYLDLIKAYHDRPEQVKKNVQSVEDAIARIVTIIRQLSSVMVRTRLPLFKANVLDLLNSSIKRYQAEYRISSPVTIEHDQAELQIDTNIEAFEEVLSHILINAWESYGEADPSGRPITVVTSITDDREGKKMLEIHVHDSGRGIDPQLRDHIFEPFISSKHTVGVGMGLTVARNTLRNLGGEIDLVDRPEGGTTALLRHPVEKRSRSSYG